MYMRSLLQVILRKSSWQHFAGIHDTLGIKDLFNLLHPLNAGFALGIVEGMRLHDTNTVFRRNGALIFG